MNCESPLLTDLYQLNMMQAYLDRGETRTAVFEFFARTLPARRGFLLAAGLEQALDYLERLHFSAADLDWLRSTGRFNVSQGAIGTAQGISAALSAAIAGGMITLAGYSAAFLMLV